MKKILIGLCLMLSTLLYSQKNTTDDKLKTNQISIGYGVNNLGKSAHLLYGYQLHNNLFYGGLRWQENSFYNLSDPENYEVYRHDQDGKPVGFILGYQRYFPISNSAITPLAALDLEYAYLNSRENAHSYNSQTGTFETKTYENPARSLLVPSLNVGFEAQIYKQLYLKQIIGVSGLFDNRYKYPGASIYFSSFNGINFNARLSVLYRF